MTRLKLIATICECVVCLSAIVILTSLVFSFTHGAILIVNNRVYHQNKVLVEVDTLFNCESNQGSVNDLVQAKNHMKSVVKTTGKPKGNLVIPNNFNF